MRIEFDDSIRTVAPGLRVIRIEADVVNSPTSDDLWGEIESACEAFRAGCCIDRIKSLPAIEATRLVYKRLGKEPNRYRPSAEALCRRIINGKGLYRLTTLVDLINLVSVLTGYSIGGFDADRIDGDVLCLGVGRENEEFHAIGRGLLNIEGLPVYRDSAGGIGTPTSDCERTKLTLDTRRLLMLVNVYGVQTPVDHTVEIVNSLLCRYASAVSVAAEVLMPGETVSKISG